MTTKKLRVTEDQWKAIKIAAIEAECSPSEMLSRALKLWLSAAVAAGDLSGSVVDGRRRFRGNRKASLAQDEVPSEEIIAKAG